MERFKIILKLQFFALLAIVAVLSFSTSTSAAEKLPYEYTFEKTDETYNGFKGVKEMVITFDEPIPSTTDKVSREVKLYQGSNEMNSIINIEPIPSGSNTLTITFKNLEYLNFTDDTKQDFRLVIGNKANVVEAQTQDFVLPFKLHEVLPGFNSIFIESTEDAINKNIFKHTAPRDVQVHIPKAYITQIETIHRYQGVTSTKDPSLTNIDVLTDAETARMKAWIGPNYKASDKNSRDLDYRSDMKGFSMGQAGIDALVCQDPTTPCNKEDFHLVAYDQYGKKLTQRSFKIKVNNKEKDFIINDYIPKPDAVFGRTVSLYELMADVKLVTAITEHIPVSDFDKLGVTYALSNSQSVNSLEQLQLALANPDIKTINITAPIIVPSNYEVVIDRNVTIKDGIINGDVKLGDGSQDLTVRLDGVTINGDLTIDVGANGTAILNKSTATDTNIISGGVNSIYLFDFVTGNIKLNNTTPVRIVNGFGSTQDLNIQLNSPEEVTLEGLAGKLNIDVAENINAKLTVKNSRGSIAQGNASPQGKLNLKVSDLVTLDRKPEEWIVEWLSSDIEGGKPVIGVDLQEVSKSSIDWASGVDLEIPAQYEFEDPIRVIEHGFGEATVTISGITLTITNAQSLPVTADVKLKGETADAIYKFTIKVTVE